MALADASSTPDTLAVLAVLVVLDPLAEPLAEPPPPVVSLRYSSLFFENSS